MVTKPVKKAQTADIDQSIQIALDAADASMDVTAEFERISAQFSETAAKAAKLEKTARLGVMVAGGIALLAVLIMGVVWQRSSSGLERLAATNTQLLTILSENVAGFEQSAAPLTELDERMDMLDAQVAQILAQFDDLAVQTAGIEAVRASLAQMTVDMAGFETQDKAGERADVLAGALGERIATLNGELAVNVSTAMRDALSAQVQDYQGLVSDISEVIDAIGGGANAQALAELQQKMDAQVAGLTMRLNQVSKARSAPASPRKAASPQPDVIKYP